MYVTVSLKSVKSLEILNKEINGTCFKRIQGKTPLRPNPIRQNPTQTQPHSLILISGQNPTL